ncbi:MAG: hypothetical protein F7C35_02325 [Desulfurococcales archaeon]|nr:hypothetical protein [Desulfurococcales archaeon]
MAKKKGKRGKKSGKGSSIELGGTLESLVLWLEKHSMLIGLILLALIVVAGTYVRILPALKYKLELDASDPWIVYWETKYFHEHGLTNLAGLKDVKEFWWPIGRDFTKSEYLGTAWLAAATYPIGEAFGLTLRQWLALFPVFAGVTTIILLYVFMLRVTRSQLAALSAASFFAFFPGAIVRTTVGFVEKISIAIPFILLFLLFMFETVKSYYGKAPKRKQYINAALAGVFGGLTAYFWGGFIFVIILFALIVILDPVAGRPNREKLYLYTVAGAIALALMVASPKIGVKFFLINIGAAIPGSLIIYGIEAFLTERGVASRILKRGVDWRFQLWLIAFFAVLAGILIQSGFIGYQNLRYAAALGIRHISPLVESIQENQPAPMRAILREYGLAILFGLAGMVFFLVRVAGGYRKPFYLLSRTIIYISFIFAVYINKQLSYFTQISSFFAVLGGGVGIADIIAGGIEAERLKTGKKGRKRVEDPMKVMAGIFVVLIVVVGAAYYSYQGYRQNEFRAPQILTSGLGALRTGNGSIIVPLNNAWLNAFAWIRNNTAEDAVIVAWWDYGYWITVNTGRRTVADGVTFNETQIRWLAELLTGKEGTAQYMLKEKFKAVPGNTYIVFYEVFNGILNKQQGNITVMYPMLGTARAPQSIGDVGVITHGIADFGKSIQMLRISYRIPPFDPRAPFDTKYSSTYTDPQGFKYIHFPGFVGGPEENVSTVKSTLLYQMALNGIPAIKRVGVFDGSKCEGIFENSTLVVPYVVASLTGGGQLSPQPVLAPPLKHFRPAAISVSCPIISENPQRGTVSFTAVVVFIYQWTG